MLNRSLSAVGSRIDLRSLAKPRVARCILAGAIVPASLAWVPSSSAADVNIPPNFTINSDVGSPVYTEGLMEGFVGDLSDRHDDDETTPNPNNSSPELTIRMGQLNPGDPPDPSGFPDSWANSRTWIYTGQIQITSPFLAFAMNNDDTDWLKINGVIVLDDNQWDNPIQALSGGAGNNLNTPSTGGVPNLVAGLGLQQNTWYDIEFRISDTGAGGAGPSGQGGWPGDFGVGMNTTGLMADGITPLDTSVNAADYIRPAEPAGGGATLFRYQSGFGFVDDFRLTANGTITINGNNPNVTEPSLRFEAGAPATLTVNDGTGAHKVLTIANGTGFVTSNQSVTIAGTTDIHPGAISDGAATGNTLTHVGPGALFIEPFAGNDLNGTTLRSGTGGHIFIRGLNGTNPVASLTTPLTISGTGGIIEFGDPDPNKPGIVYDNSFAANEDGSIVHAAAGANTLGSATKGVAIAAGKTLTVNNTGGLFTLAGPITGGSGTLTKAGTSPLRTSNSIAIGSFVNAGGMAELRGDTSLTNLTVNAGRVEVPGKLTLPNSPAIANGATLALYNLGTNVLPSTITLPTGNLEIYPTALGPDTNGVNLTGGTLTLATNNGLSGSFYSGDDAGANTNFALGPDFFLTYTNYFNARTPAVTALTSAGGITELNYPNGDYATFGAYGFNDINNFVSRMTGKISIPVDGVYNFGTTSDDGSVIYIDGQLLVNNNFYQGPMRRDGNIGLSAGLHDIDIGFYEGGVTQALIVDWTVPGGTRATIPNTVLFPSASAISFNNPMDVVQNSTINVSAPSAIVNALTVRSGATLATSGSQLTAPILTLPAPGSGTGTYTLSPSNTFIVGNIAEGGPTVAINLVKAGTGVLTLDNTTTPQLQNNADTIRVDQGLVGFVMQTGGLNPFGNATLTMNGGGVLVTSKGGNQTFSLPYTLAGNGAIVAGQTGSGVDGTPATPIVITVANPLTIPANRTFTLGSQNNYVLNVSGTTTGTGTMAISGGTVNAANRATVNGLKVSMNPPAGTATLNVKESGAVTVQSLSSSGAGASQLVLGDGTNAVDLTINGSDEGFFSGLITQAANTVVRLIRDGTGKQTLAHPANNYSGGTRIVGGILSVLTPDSTGSGAIELAGGTLQTPQDGLLGEYYDASKGGAAGANAAFGDITTFNTYFDAKGTPTVSALTSSNGRTNLRFTTSTAIEAGGSNTAIFADQGFNALDNMAVRFTGNFYAFTGGDYTFTTRSDDGSMLFVDGQAVVISNVDQGMTTKAGLITLTPGVHALTVGFNENGGDQGLEVRYTPPGGVDQFIPNSVLPRYVSTKTLNLTTSSTVDLQNSVALPGALNHSPGVTLTTTAGTAVFPQVNLVAPSPAGPAAYTYAANGTVIVQDFADGGRPVTINKTGTGNLLLNATTPQFTNANDVINVTQGTVTALLGGTANANPLGQASLILNGGGLRVSSAGGDINFSKPFTISGNASLEAGNYGGGAVDGVKATFTNALNVASGQTLTTRSTSGYTLALKAVSGAGTLAVDGGLVALEGATNPNTVVVSSGVATVTSGTLSPAGGTSVNGTGILDFDPGTGVTANYAGGPIAINGGTIRAQSGIANLGTAPISFTPRSSTVVPNALLARLVDIGPAGSVFPGNTDAGINGGIAAPGIERPISAPISFLPYQAADGTFSTFFGGGNVDRFTAVFVGDFKAPVTGAYQAQIAQEDDNGGFWIDLNQNGIFESTGSAGNELMSGRGCCGDGPVGTANLVANQTYRVAMAVEDTGGGSSVVARAALPGGTLTTVNPGDAAQAGLWSYQQFSGGGNIQVAADAELRVNSLSGATDVNLIGSNATLRVSGASTVDVLRNTATFGETQTVDIAANQSLVAGRLVVSDNSTLIKAGAGTLTATTQGLSPNSTLQLDAGTIELNGPETATANTGMVAVNGGTLRVNGAISGTVNVAAAGTVEGPGRVGPLISAGIVSPGVAATPVGTLTTADLTLTGGTLRLDIQNTTAYDRLAVTGTVSLQNNPQLQAFLAGGTIAQGDLFFIVNNDGTDPVVGAFAGITNNGGPGAPGFTVLNGQAFFVSYFGDSATNAFDTAGGNDIVLRAVPEPQTWATVMSGIGALIGLQRFRRRR